MKNKYLLLLFLAVTATSCKRILLYSAGIREPKEESKESLKKYVFENNLDTNDVYIPKDTAAFYKLNKISSFQSGYAFFNSKKEMLMYKDTGSACSAPVFVFADNLCLNEDKLFYKKYTTAIIIDKIRPLCNKESVQEKYDKYVFIFWYKYFGKKKFKGDVIDIVNRLKKNNCKIKIYLVNLDLQPGWKKDIPIRIS